MANKCPTCHFDNPETQRFCGTCGTKLDASASGHPPGSEARASLTRTLEASADELTRGMTFAGRYEIIEELGTGGMGRVYRAHDSKLNEEVALKLIKPEIAAERRVVERFRNELKTARKITHKNVCRMHDFHEEGKTLYLTMEYVRGEDLKSLIHRMKALAVGAAVSVARQVAEGLGEAHKLGIVHRDLKPGNIMIDKEGQAKIMDFGIARSLAGGGTTAEGAIIGTPEYMSPEQVEGKGADQRSDLYALGIILFEMVTGRLPFEGETPFSIANKQKYEPAPDPRKLNPQIPAELDRVILRSLEKAKEKRYQTTGEFLADLAAVEEALPTGERISAQPKPKTSREITVKFTPKKLLVPGIVFLALIAAGIILWRIIHPTLPTPPPSASGRPTLAILSFENNSGDTKLDNWRDGLAVLLIADLSQSKFIRVISGEEMYTILKRLGLADARKYSSEDIERIAVQCGATHILRGNFIKAGEIFVITASLQRHGTAESSTALRLEAHGENEIIPKINELTRQVKEGLNLTATQIASDIEKEAGKITTSSPEALKYYTEGRKLQNKAEYEKSISYMEKAVEIDPEFAMAYRSMGAAHSNLHHVAEMYKNYKKAFDFGHRLPDNERLLIEAQWFSLNDNPAKAIEILEELVQIYPGHLTGNFALAYTYFGVGDYDKAIERWEFCIQYYRTAVNVWDLAVAYMAKGLYQKAEDVCRSFLRDVEEQGHIRSGVFFTYLCRRKFELALAEAEKLYLLGSGWKGYKGIVLFCKNDFAGAEKLLVDYDWQMRLLIARGKINETIGLSQRNLEKSKGDKLKEARAYEELAGALEKGGLYEKAYQAFAQLFKPWGEYLTESGLPYWLSDQKRDLITKGRIQAEMGSFDQARKTADELKSLIEKGIDKRELPYYEYILGLIELGKKNYRQAKDLFSKACGRLAFEVDADPLPDHALFFDGLARALYGSGDLDNAQKEYEKITLLTLGRLKHGDIYAKAYYMLGKIAEQQGDKARAVQNYRKFLDLWKDADPGLPEVEDAKRRLAAL